MQYVWSAFISTWLSICGVWVGLLIAQLLAKSKGLLLHADRAPALPAHPPPVVVIVPARNEAANIGRCVRSVLNQDYPAFRLVVVDDRSEDQTAEILSQIAVHEPRLQVICNRELPSGWMGKSHALHVGSREGNEDWLLFVDADCELDPPAIRVAVATALDRNVGMLSLWPRQAEGGFWEHLLIPLCAGIIALWYGSPKQNNSSGRRPFANGQFLLMKRDAYEQIGGHEAVRTALIEDVMLAERIAAHGIRSWAGSGAELLAVRMYTSLSEIMNGWSRIYVGALRSRLKLMISISWLLWGSLLPYLALLWVCVHLWVTGRDGLVEFIAALSALHLLLMMIVSFRFWGLGHCRRVYLLAYPLSVVIVIMILLRANRVLRGRSSVLWRGTAYQVAATGSIT